jgi:hypothetical protein
VLQYAGDSDPGVRQAAVYTLGVCIEQAPEAMKPHANLILQKLAAVITSQDAKTPKYVYATENAIAAVGRVIKVEVLDNNQLLSTWISWLPVLKDTVESKVTYNLLCDFIEKYTNVIVSNYLNQIVSIFMQILNTDLVDQPLTHRIVQILKRLPQDRVRGAANSLTQTQQQLLHTVLSS